MSSENWSADPQNALAAALISLVDASARKHAEEAAERRLAEQNPQHERILEALAAQIAEGSDCFIRRNQRERFFRDSSRRSSTEIMSALLYAMWRALDGDSEGTDKLISGIISVCYQLDEKYCLEHDSQRAGGRSNAERQSQGRDALYAYLDRAYDQLLSRNGKPPGRVALQRKAQFIAPSDLYDRFTSRFVSQYLAVRKKSRPVAVQRDIATPAGH